MVFCQQCGGENVDDARFCVHCGAQIQRTAAREETGEAREQRAEPASQIQSQPEPEPEPQPEPESKRAEPSEPAPRQTPPEPLREKAEPSKPRPSMSLQLSDPKVIAVIIAVAAVAAFAVGLLVAGSLDGNGDDGAPANESVAMSVQDFFNALQLSVDGQNRTCSSSIAGVGEGDTLQLTGTVDRLVPHNESEIPAIGEYTSVVLPYNETAVLPIHAMGNLTAVLDEGDTVTITLHPVEVNGAYPDITNTTWQLSGEFFQEQFIFGVFSFDLIVAPDQIAKV